MARKWAAYGAAFDAGWMRALSGAVSAQRSDPFMRPPFECAVMERLSYHPTRVRRNVHRFWCDTRESSANGGVLMSTGTQIKTGNINMSAHLVHWGYTPKNDVQKPVFAMNNAAVQPAA